LLEARQSFIIEKRKGVWKKKERGSGESKIDRSELEKALLSLFFS